MPKNILAHIPIIKAKEASDEAKEKIDALLIDDDPYNHEFWQYVATEKNKIIKCFVSQNAFLAASVGIAKDIPIYIDLNLTDQNGLEVAKALHKIGYKKLYITTGYANFDEREYPFLSGIIGKEPPF